MSLAEKGLAARVRRCMEELALSNESLPEGRRLPAACFFNLAKAVPLARQEARWSDKQRFLEVWREHCCLGCLTLLHRLPLHEGQSRTLDELEQWAAAFADELKD